MRMLLAFVLAAGIGLSASAYTSFRHDLSAARQRVLPRCSWHCGTRTACRRSC
jgi:hypothetical protein